MLQRLDYSRFREPTYAEPDYTGFCREYVAEDYEIKVGSLVLGPFKLTFDVSWSRGEFIPGNTFALESVHYDGRQTFLCRSFGAGRRALTLTLEDAIEAEVSAHIERIWPDVEAWAAEEAAMGRG
jgi:hypothetical protein